MKPQKLFRQLWVSWLRPILAVAVIVLPFKSSVAELNFVPSGSMKPTILEGEFIFVDKLAYDLKVPFTTTHLAEWDSPSRGDVVVLFSPEDGMRLVKRVVAVPGDTVTLRDNALLINGVRASYAPVSEKQLHGLTDADRQSAQFATESVENRSHTVMAYPSRFFARRSFSPVTLGADDYFVMGDNRDNSKDSRYFGVVKRRLIVGKAVAVTASVDKPGNWMPRLDRFFTSLK
jgi:signal peptidase I